MSSSQTVFTVKQTVQGTFELSQEFDNVVTVIGTYKSKSYAVRKLKQLFLKAQNPSTTYFVATIKGDDWETSECVLSEVAEVEVEAEAEDEATFLDILYLSGQYVALAVKVQAKQEVLTIEELQNHIDKLNNLSMTYASLPEDVKQRSKIPEHISYAMSIFEAVQNDLMNQSESVSVQTKQADGANIGKAQADEVCAIGEVLPPTSNTGGLTIQNKAGTVESAEIKDLPDFLKNLEVFEEIKNLKVSETYRQLVMENGQVKEVMLRRGLNTPAFIDTISFTINEQAFHRFEDTVETDFKQHGKVIEKTRRIDGPEALAEGIAEFLELVGLPVMGEGNGRNGYQSALLLGNEEQQRNYGFIAYGGHQQNGSVMFHLTGEGLTMARNGWELFLYAWLKKHGALARITRVDIAHDMLFGGYKVEQAVNDWKNDCYTVRQTRPHCEIQGTDWLSGTNKGKTAYIGSKKSSRILYFYEKGKQLGDENSEWVRVELRQRNKDYIIPFDVLLYSGDYLCSAYPHLSKVLDYDFSEQYQFERIKKTNGIGLEHVIKYAKMQVSPAIQMLKSIGLDEREIVKELFNEKARFPKRLILDNPNHKDED